MAPRKILPSVLLKFDQTRDLLPGVPVAYDTETSGLRPDAGARISTVSVAFIPGLLGPAHEKRWLDAVGGLGQTMWDGGIVTVRPEPILADGTEMTVFSFAWPFDQGVAGTGKPEDSGQLELFSSGDNLDLREWCRLIDWLKLVGADAGLAAHHGKFDQMQFRYGCRRWPGVTADLSPYLVWDTQNGNDLLWGYLASTSLKGPGTVSEKLWGETAGDEKEKIAAYLRKNKLPAGRWDLMPWFIIAKYADQDARLTIRLQVRQEHEMQNQPRFKGWLDGRNGRMHVGHAFRRRMDVTQLLHRMEMRGLPFDVEAAWTWSAELKNRARALEAQLPFDPPTLDMAKHYWFGDPDSRRNGYPGGGREPLNRTKTGAPSLTAEDVDKVVAMGLPGAAEWRELAKITDADSRWYEGWASKAGPDGRLRTSVRQNGTRSGRFSVEGIQLQAIPHAYRLEGYDSIADVPTPRELIGAAVPEGWQMWELDLANAELRVASLFAGCQRMLEMIEAGMDLHGETAKELLHADPESEAWGKQRTVAKRANFSLIFGVGWPKLQANIAKETGILLSDREADQLVTGWNAMYPEFRRAIRQHDRKVMDRYWQHSKTLHAGWLQMANGERRWFRTDDVKSVNPSTGLVDWGAHKAFNQRVQPSLAQFGMNWWMESEEYIESMLTPDELAFGGMVLLVHDSEVLLLPDDRAEEIVQGCQDIGVNLWGKTFSGVPGGVDAKRWGK